jgi:hypothetical protein
VNMCAITTYLTYLLTLHKQMIFHCHRIPPLHL